MSDWKQQNAKLPTIDARVKQRATARRPIYKVLCGRVDQCGGVLGELALSNLPTAERERETARRQSLGEQPPGKWRLHHAKHFTFRRHPDGSYEPIDEDRAREMPDGHLRGRRRAPIEVQTPASERHGNYLLHGHHVYPPAVVRCPQCGRRNHVVLPDDLDRQ